MASLCVRLTDDTVRELDNLAARGRLNRSSIVRAALDFGVEKLKNEPELLLRGVKSDETPDLEGVADRLSKLVKHIILLHGNELGALLKRLGELEESPTVAKPARVA